MLIPSFLCLTINEIQVYYLLNTLVSFKKEVIMNPTFHADKPIYSQISDWMKKQMITGEWKGRISCLLFGKWA